tara:strand:- start:606 stop:1010 length:405 start_codon:yes stop_codon:yes gene_type:complete
MTEYEIYNQLSSSFIASGLFVAGGWFLLWVAFRGVLRIQDNGATLIQKVFATLFSLGIVYYNLLQFSFVTVNWQNASEALSLLDNPSERAQRMMDFVGTTEVSPSLIPSDPIFAVWWLVVIVMLMTGIWLKPQN